MPIYCHLAETIKAASGFEDVDRVVMRCAFASHNKLGRLCNESVYESDMAERLKAEGFGDVHTQVPVTASYGEFRKTYKLDLVVSGMVYELKAVETLLAAHDAQVFHYAALLDAARIKLLNFGSYRVEGRLRCSPFVITNRRDVAICRQRWTPLSGGCAALAHDAEGCFREWGGFLDGGLFNEALTSLRGGEAECVRRIPVGRDGIHLGHHKLAFHADDTAFVVTTHGANLDIHEKHLKSLKSALPIRGIQWINIHHATMTMTTIS